MGLFVFNMCLNMGKLPVKSYDCGAQTWFSKRWESTQFSHPQLCYRTFTTWTILRQEFVQEPDAKAWSRNANPLDSNSWNHGWRVASQYILSAWNQRTCIHLSPDKLLDLPETQQSNLYIEENLQYQDHGIAVKIKWRSTAVLNPKFLDSNTGCTAS